VYVNSLIYVVCQCSMIMASTGNMAKEVFNVLIVRLKKKVSVQAPFRHRYRFKSTGLAPVSEKNQTIPIPSCNARLRQNQEKASSGRRLSEYSLIPSAKCP